MKKTCEGVLSTMKSQKQGISDALLEMKKTCEGVLSTMKSQKQGISAQQMAASIVEKVVAAEEALSACQDAEMPFLKGIEVLPTEESSKAISDYEAAAAQTFAAVNQAKTETQQRVWSYEPSQTRKRQSL